ncbi:MAG TPA: phosphatidate cytidylyltransferase, partial [Candidatus Latescibacteria bacterium]|nr:phosphatidate cytidylyltransferase [Candidatus Latescibacterota bacterium]
GKSIEGSLACLIACFVAGTAWAELPLACVWTGAVVATLAEALPLRVNDNAIIPVSSGAAMAGLMFLFM